MPRRKPFTKSDVEGRQQLGRIFSDEQRKQLAKAAEVTGDNAEAMLRGIDALLQVERLRRLADWQERPAAVADAMRRIVEAFEQFRSALLDAPLSVRSDMQRAFGVFDIEEGLLRARRMLEKVEAQIVGHNPKRDDRSLTELARHVADVGCAHSAMLRGSRNGLADWVYGVLEMDGFIDGDNLRDWDAIVAALEPPAN